MFEEKNSGSKSAKHILVKSLTPPTKIGRLLPCIECFDSYGMPYFTYIIPDNSPSSLLGAIAPNFREHEFYVNLPKNLQQKVYRRQQYWESNVKLRYNSPKLLRPSRKQRESSILT